MGLLDRNPLLDAHASSAYLWREVVPDLVEAGYRTHVFDLLGYGLSERPWDPDADTSMTGNVASLLVEFPGYGAHR